MCLGVSVPYPCGVLVSLEREMQHLTGLVTLLVDQLIANAEQAREAALDNLVEVSTVIALCCLVSESPAKCQKTLKTSKNGSRLVGVEQLHSEIDKSRPS